MMDVGGTGWDEYGRLVAAVGMVAMLAYLLPAMVAMSPQWARRMQIGAIALLGLALVLAVLASLAWFLR